VRALGEARVIIDRLRLDDRTVLVAGAGGAIGSIVAQRLAEAGATLVLVDNDADRLDACAAALNEASEVPATHSTEVADVADIDAVRALVARTVARFGRIDGALCLVGGVHPDEFGPMIDFGMATYDSILDRNLRSAVVVHQCVAAAMAADNLGGSIVSISAATGLASSPFHALYGAAKAALIALARTEAVEWGPSGIRVNTVAPGGVQTRPAADPEEMARSERAAVPLGRRAVPDDIAGAVLFLLSDLSSYITGHTLVLDGGALAKPAFFDADNVPVFVTDAALRARMRAASTRT
jgi:NAD(P)-dependent dehydrogenase (short-subunit alcohol dehydrogenase family)